MREPLERNQRPPQMGDSLIDRAPLGRVLSGGQPMGGGIRVHAGAREVVRKQLRLTLDQQRETRRQHFRNPRVVALSRRAKERVVGGVADQRVVESVNEGIFVVLAEEARTKDRKERSPHVVSWLVRDGR